VVLAGFAVDQRQVPALFLAAAPAATSFVMRAARSWMPITGRSVRRVGSAVAFDDLRPVTAE